MGYVWNNDGFFFGFSSPSARLSKLGAALPKSETINSISGEFGISSSRSTFNIASTFAFCPTYAY